MSSRLIRLWVRLLGGATLVLILIWSFFSPEIVSTYWHLRFGDSITFHQWKVPVPKHWAVLSRSKSFILQRPTRFYESEDVPTISLEALNPGKPVNPEYLKQNLVQAIQADGYSFQAETPIQIAANNGYCLQFKSTKNPQSFRISCDSLAAELSLDYFGPKSEVETFYSVVSRIGADQARAK